jgi:hypothetical protein
MKSFKLRQITGETNQDSYLLVDQPLWEHEW